MFRKYSRPLSATIAGVLLRLKEMFNTVQSDYTAGFAENAAAEDHLTQTYVFGTCEYCDEFTLAVGEGKQ